jgi:hypothetical protein
MSCPFGYGGLRAVQAMEQDQAARVAAGAAADTAIDNTNGVSSTTNGATTTNTSGPNNNNGPTTPARTTNQPQTVSSSPGVLSPPQAPLSLWTGGLRTSLGVENAHPLAVWMKEMQARGGLKGVDIEKELLGLTLPPAADELLEAQREKNWKEKRERPPVELDSIATGVSDQLRPPPTPSPSVGSNPTHPTQLHFYPGMFGGRINHNSHANESPMTKYDQEITYWNYIHPEVLSSLQNGRQGKGLNHHDEVSSATMHTA